MKLKEAEDALEIDKHDLDNENVRQPQLMFDVSREWARAKSTLERLKRDKTNLNSQLDHKIREEAKRKDEKLTEAMIPHKIRMTKEMTDLNQEILEAEESVDIWAGMIESVKQRSQKLHDLCSLYQANYYQTEVGGRESRESAERVARKVRESAGRQRRAGRQDEEDE